jgi:hypothetical protein
LTAGGSEREDADMTRNQVVQSLIDRANAFVGNGQPDDEITPDEVADAISDAITETAEVNAQAAGNGNGEVTEADTDDTPASWDEVDAAAKAMEAVQAEDSESKRQKYEPTNPDAVATFGQKRLLQTLATYSDGEPIRLLYASDTDERGVVDSKWNAGLAFEAIDAMLHYSRWVHPQGYSLVPDADAVTKFHNSQKA